MHKLVFIAWLLILSASSLEDFVAPGNPGILRFPAVNKTNIVFVYAGDGLAQIFRIGCIIYDFYSLHLNVCAKPEIYSGYQSNVRDKRDISPPQTQRTHMADDVLSVSAAVNLLECTLHSYEIRSKAWIVSAFGADQ